MKTNKLGEVCALLERRSRLVEDCSCFGMLGPLNIAAESETPRYGFTDEAIREVREGGPARDHYKNSRIYAAGKSSDDGVAPGHLVTMSAERLAESKEKSFSTIADMMLLAQAGVLVMETYSESADLCRWKTHPGFKAEHPEEHICAQYAGCE